MKRIYFRNSLACFILCSAVAAGSAACVKLPRRAAVPAENPAPAAAPGPAPRINLNLASPQELERLPGVGPGLAARIVEHRQRFGPFRRAEHLLAVRGISERRFRELQNLVTVE